MDSPLPYAIVVCQIGVDSYQSPDEGEAQMKVERIGIDLAKQVFQVHGVDGHGEAQIRKTFRRDEMADFFANLEPCLIGLEACGSAHYTARVLRKFGHDVRLIALQFVASYQKNEKNDSNDAEAICEEVDRPNMRFVAIKDPEQQAVLVVHRIREHVVGERTVLINQARGLLGGFGIIFPQGADKLRKSLPDILEDAENDLPDLGREMVAEQRDQSADLDERNKHYDRRIRNLVNSMPHAKRLMAVEGVGPVIATALIATIGDARLFDNGRRFAAWLGLVPRQYSTGGKQRYGRITKRGDVYLRALLVHGSRAVLCRTKGETDAKSQWAAKLKERRGFNMALVALAAKQARILWALLARDQDYAPAEVA
jgi:transposase